MGVSIGRRSRALWVVGLAVALGATSSLAEAQRRGRAPRGPSIAEAQPLLDSTNPDEIRLGLETAVTVGGAPAAEAIAQRIRRGLPAEVLDSAIDSLAALGRREAGPVLFELLNHRRATIRAHAAEAVVAVAAQGADRALVASLSDGDPAVRSAAALGLGRLGARSAANELFLALERGVLEAATALGQVVDAAGVDRLLGFLGRVPLDALTPGFDELFARNDVQERTKLALIGRLEGLATPEVKNYLATTAEVLPEGAVRRAAQAASERIVE
ncbi:MAG: HEAT repeat domain-containing protein [Polyangiales bacterium]